MRGDFAYNKSYSAGYPVGVIRRLDRYVTGIVSPLYICFRPNLGFDSDFLRHYFEAGRVDEQIAWVAKEGVRNHGLLNVGVDDFFSVDVDLPPIGEQRRIASILDSVDESIRSTERLLDKLALTTKGALHNLLEELVGAATSPQIMRPLGSIGRIRSGSTPSRALHSRYFANGSIPWVKTMDLNEGVVASTDERITGAAVSDYSCPILEPMTVLVAMYGGWAQIGRTAILGCPGTINQAISAVEVQDTSVDPFYVQLALQVRRDRWKGIAASTRKDPNVTRADVLAFEIPVPRLEAQRKIVAASNAAKLRVKAEQMKLAKLRRFKDGLREDLLTGRVRVRT
ncbi:restriction endonuclease subunit S [Micromonospora ureilytica]|uniref:restriction endonuclease subunit S n=1 Tax=Micromonospora ureilytica TaxID=709868 RepID=UPI0033CD5739